MTAAADTRKQRLRFQCATAGRLCIEPWGEEIVIEPGARYEIEADGPYGDCLEFFIEGETITLYGWSGSTVELFRGGSKLISCMIPAPPTPHTS